MKLNQITDCTYSIDAAVNLGVIVNQHKEALLIDTGIDDSVSRKVKRLLEENGLRIRGIIITHAHADHSGGAAHLAKTTGARVYASEAEKSVLENPLLEPVYLFSGAHPPAPLRSKFFLAPPVRVDEVIAPGVYEFSGFEDMGIEVLDLGGHALGQVGMAVDGVCFCTDAVIAPDYIAKHGIPLNAHLGKTLETFDRLEKRGDRVFLPAHGSLVEDIRPLTTANRSRVSEAMGRVLEELKSPRTAEEVTAAVCASFGVEITNLGQHCLMHLTIMAYLSHFLDAGRIRTDYHRSRQTFSRNS